MKKAIVVEDVMELTRDKITFPAMARSILTSDICQVVFDSCLTGAAHASVDACALACADAYEILFKANLRMNQYVGMYDAGLMNEIASKGAGVAECEREEFVRRIRNALDKKNRTAYKVDCHTHTSERSGCAKHDARTICKRAKEIGLNGIFLTDHGILTPLDVVAELNEAFAPLQVYSGTEIHIDGDDFLVLGIHDEALNKQEWVYEDLHHFVMDHGGYMALAHPLRYWDGIRANILSYRPHAIEQYSYNMRSYKPAKRQAALDIANGLNLHLVANSDAHADNGLCYCNIMDRHPRDENDLIGMLKNGEYKLGYLFNDIDKDISYL